MKAALEQLKAYDGRPRRFPHLQRNLAVVLLAAAASFTGANAVCAWLNYASGQPFHATVERIDHGFPGSLDYRFTLRLEPGNTLAVLRLGLNNCSETLPSAEIGSRHNVWASPERGYLSIDHRMPVVLTVLPLAFLGLLLIALRFPAREQLPRKILQDPGSVWKSRKTLPDGMIEVTLHHRWTENLGLLFFLGGAIGVITFLLTGVIASTVHSEALAREYLAMVGKLLLQYALIGLLAFVPIRTRFGWDGRRVRIDGTSSPREAIRRVAIVPRGEMITLQIRCDGREKPLVFRSDVLWLAGMLESLGYEIEFSEKAI